MLHHLAHLDHRSAAVVRQGVVADVEGAGADAVDAVRRGDDPVGADDGAAAAVRRPLQGDLVRRGAVGRLGAADDVAVGVKVLNRLFIVLLSNRRAEGDRDEGGEQEEFHGCWWLWGCLGCCFARSPGKRGGRLKVMLDWRQMTVFYSKLCGDS